MKRTTGALLLATIIDLIFIFLVGGYAIAAPTGNTTSGGFELEGILCFLLLGIAVVYFIGMEYTTGTTLGRMLLGIKSSKCPACSGTGKYSEEYDDYYCWACKAYFGDMK